jgi:hypothetical protein
MRPLIFWEIKIKCKSCFSSIHQHKEKNDSKIISRSRLKIFSFKSFFEKKKMKKKHFCSHLLHLNFLSIGRKFMIDETSWLHLMQLKKKDNNFKAKKKCFRLVFTSMISHCNFKLNFRNFFNIRNVFFESSFVISFWFALITYFCKLNFLSRI